jgi:hypothetical protein
MLNHTSSLIITGTVFGGQVMSKTTHKCAHCREQFKPNPRVKNQKYCGKRECRKARRAKWQRDKIATDEDYRENQKICSQKWEVRHPGYYRQYRRKHPEYTERNRILQQIRNNRRSNNRQGKLIAKMDSLIRPYYLRDSLFRIVPQKGEMIAKMDSLIVKLSPVQRIRN